MKTNKLLMSLLLVGAALLIVLIAVLGVMMVSDGGQDQKSYTKSISSDPKSLSDSEYEQEAARYRAVIEEEPDDDEGYYQLATLMLGRGEIDEAYTILVDGFRRTSSPRLSDMIVRHYGFDGLPGAEGGDDGEEKNTPSGGRSVTMSVVECNNIAVNTYKQYKEQYGTMDTEYHDGVFTAVSYSEGATLYFFDEGGDNVLNSSDEPFDTVRPNYVTFTNLVRFFVGANRETRLNADDLKAAGVTRVERSHDTSLGGEFVRFEYYNCQFEIASNNGEFSMSSANRVRSVYGTGSGYDEEDETPSDPVLFYYEATLRIIDSTTGYGVPNATVTLRDPMSREGFAYSNITDSDGNVRVRLLPADYVVYVECEGFITEEFDLTVSEQGAYSTMTFMISPELGDANIRIVLEWGEYPFDLDSHLCTEDGSSIVVYYAEKEYYKNGELAAELDVDDVDGYGPETITVYDTSENFTYRVHDFTQSGSMFSRTDITVKVYVNDTSAPLIFTIPTDPSNSGTDWDVFSIVNGQIVPK